MIDAYNVVLDITSRNLPERELRRSLNDFSYQLGWRPSYQIIEKPFVDNIAKAHLVVEHGLEPAAVITFIDRATPFPLITDTQLNHFLEISYNNLADWHICVESDRVHFFFNRSKNRLIANENINRNNYDNLSNDAFDRIVGRKPNPNYPNLDDALMRTISTWKRNLTADIGDNISNEHLSALFNGIIFSRAVEDHSRYRNGSISQILLHELDDGGTLREIIKRSLTQLLQKGIRKELFDGDKLTIFDKLDSNTLRALFYDFYYNRHAPPYNYDFSLISKHALSRIYEHYSSILFVEKSPQASLFPPVPEEAWNKTYGSVYTPQFIARFFARFIHREMTPGAFQRIQTVDPACGSGIFLRTLLELQCDPLQDCINSEIIDRAFDKVHGFDIDENASHATKLSLALLYLTLRGTLPEHLNNILTLDSLSYFTEHPDLKNTFDVVLMNPPFIASGTQSQELRQRIADYMGPNFGGWRDTYLAFLSLGLDALKPGGFGLYVLPHSFLLSNSATGMRRRLSEETWIRCLADLSNIKVFGNLGTYIILLIFEKKINKDANRPSATIINCQELVGHALEDYLEGRQPNTKLYSIDEVDQDEFTKATWIILPKVDASIIGKLRGLPKLDDFVHIYEGLITGNDNVFIIDDYLVPEGEEAIFPPLLQDKEMTRYSVPKSTGKCVFHPYQKNKKLSEGELYEAYPKTWAYLVSHRSQLEKRSSVQKRGLPWWQPIWPRKPENLFRSKIVSPHLVFLPKFSLDITGKYAVSRSPFIVAKDVASGSSAESDLLKYLLAVLNSPICYWYISNHSHKYGSGYAMLEPKTLKQVPIPDPDSALADMKAIQMLVDRLILDPSSLEVEREVGDLVNSLYGLSNTERISLGLKGG